jgi:Zn-dependent M16 (insulinase) family peptidase
MRAIMNGSEKYPVKEPFEILKRASLQTHLDAHVLQDRTVFAAASRNTKDFENLLSVYLDAIFKPKAILDDESTNWIFRQEGWRIERSDDPNIYFYNGNTLNEMKAVYSNPDEFMHQYAHQALFPDTSYRFDNQGKPKEILNLTQSDVVDYYNKYYRPSNAQVFLYGPLDAVEEGMAQFDAYASAHKAQDKVIYEPEWQEMITRDVPPHSVHPFPVTEEKEDEYRIMVTWLLNDDEMDRQTEIAWRMLDYLLLKSPIGPLRKGLENSGVGKEVISTGLRDDLRQWTFSIGMRGISKDDIASIEDTVMKILNQIETNGFQFWEVEAAFNTVEFGVSEGSRFDYCATNLPSLHLV